MELVVRNWLVQEALGLIPKEQLVRHADDYIAENDVFPDYIVKVSLSESLAREPYLDLILDPINTMDAQKIAKELLNLYLNQSISVIKIGEVSEKTYMAIGCDSEAFDLFIWISDEVDLIRNGDKTDKDFHDNINQVLSDIIAL